MAQKEDYNDDHVYNAAKLKYAFMVVADLRGQKYKIFTRQLLTECSFYNKFFTIFINILKIAIFAIKHHKTSENMGIYGYILV